jgi:hypothetical protein
MTHHGIGTLAIVFDIDGTLQTTGGAGASQATTLTASRWTISAGTCWLRAMVPSGWLRVGRGDVGRSW